MTFEVGRCQAEETERPRQSIGGVFADDDKRSAAIANINRRLLVEPQQRAHCHPRHEAVTDQLPVMGLSRTVRSRHPSYRSPANGQFDRLLGRNRTKTDWRRRRAPSSARTIAVEGAKEEDAGAFYEGARGRLSKRQLRPGSATTPDASGWRRFTKRDSVRRKFRHARFSP